MSQVSSAVLALALVVSFGHWLSMRAALHVDLRLLPDHSRRRVQWLMVNSLHVQLACALVALVAVATAFTGA